MLSSEERKEFERLKADFKLVQDELAEKNKELADTKEMLTESEQLHRGTYYSLNTGIIDVYYENIDNQAINNISRNSEFERYRLAIDAAKNWKVGDEIATKSGRSEYSATSLTTDGLDDGTAQRQAKKLIGTGINGEQAEAAQIAHCLSYATGCSAFAGPMVQAAAGVVFDDHPHERQQALIHGVLKKHTNKKGQYERQTGTGVKHYRDNMARIMHQAVYCDKDPSVLILPILELHEVLNPPSEYSALLVCTKPQVYKEMVMTEKCTTCNEDEIEMAIARLNDFLGGASLCLFNKTEEQVNSIKSKEERKEILSSFKQLQAFKQFPGVKPKDNLNGVKVMKVTFANDADASKHSGIDPWLLLFKNAIMQSAIVGYKLLPGCKFDDDCDDDEEEEEPGEDALIPECITIKMGPHEAS